MKIILTIISLVILAAGGIYLVSNFMYEPIVEEASPNEEVEAVDFDLLDNRWVWIRTDLGNGTTVQAPNDESFVLSFDEPNKRVMSTTDCNSMGGTYVKDGEVLSFGQFAMTLMYCEGSLEGVYGEQLSLVTSYTISDDTLRLNLDRDYGVMVFQKQ